jgi:hypothetical protein
MRYVHLISLQIQEEMHPYTRQDVHSKAESVNTNVNMKCQFTISEHSQNERHQGVIHKTEWDHQEIEVVNVDLGGEGKLPVANQVPQGNIE